MALFGHHGDVWDLERVELHRQYPQSDGAPFVVQRHRVLNNFNG